MVDDDEKAVGELRRSLIKDRGGETQASDGNSGRTAIKRIQKEKKTLDSLNQGVGRGVATQGGRAEKKKKDGFSVRLSRKQDHGKLDQALKESGNAKRSEAGDDGGKE